MNQVRRGGSATLPDGATVSWSVASGSRGRRWRSATRSSSGWLLESLLLELDPGGRLSKLELDTGAGLLTLHPERGTLHGNAVLDDHVRHFALPWTEVTILHVAGSLVSAAVAAASAPARVGKRLERPAILVSSALTVSDADAAIERFADGTVRVEMASDSLVVTLDKEGVPLELQSGGVWPLELE